MRKMKNIVVVVEDIHHGNFFVDLGTLFDE